MQGRIYAQRGNESGWLKRESTVSDVRLTGDLNDSGVFDVDNYPAFKLINGLIDSGWAVCIGDTLIHNIPAAPSASPFTPNH